MDAHNTSYATGNKWIADIPLSTVSSELTDTSLNLVSFSIPEIELTASDFSYMGDTVQIPTGVVNPSNKEITFNYLISGDFSQYLNLWKWVSLMATINPPVDVTEQNAGVTDGMTKYARYSIPIRVYLMDEFKKQKLSIKYENAWISNFSSLELDYNQDQIAINHSFTLKYSRFFLEEV